MDMPAAVRARLLAAPSVTNIVGQRVYWEERPQGSPYPAVVIDRISYPRGQTLKDFDMSEARVQVRVMSALSTPAEKFALGEAVTAVLVEPALVGGIQFMRATEINTVPRNERTETQFIRIDAIDFLIRWKVAA